MRGDRLLEIRKQLGHSQESLAELLGLGVRQIWRYENNKTKPDSEVVAHIARTLNVSTDYLLGLSEDPNPKNHEQLSTKERYAIAAWRRGDKYGAIKTIVADE